MPPPFLFAPPEQAAFDSTLGSTEVTLGLALTQLRQLGDSFASDNDEDDEEWSLPFCSTSLAALGVAHVARRLRRSAALDLGGTSRVTCPGVFDERECLQRFRFTAQQLEELHYRLLGNRRRIVVGHEAFNTMEALLVTNQKTAWPQRLESLSRDFNRHPSALSRMTTWVMRKYVNNTYNNFPLLDFQEF